MFGSGGLYPIQKPRIPTLDRVLPYLRQMEDSGKYSNFGPLEKSLRTRFADFFGVDESRVATCANATLAISGATEVSIPNSWFVPSFTFPATVHAVLHGRGDVHLVDVSKDEWDIDLERLNTVLSPQSGILPVAPFGSVPKIEKYAEFGYVVHDAAASIGSGADFSRLKSSHAVIYSLHATKVLGSGEGSVVVFGSQEYADEFRVWTNFGLKGSRNAHISATNAKMSEIQAAYVHAALDGWYEERNDWIASRKLVNDMAHYLGLTNKFSDSTMVSPYWILEFNESDRRSFVQEELKRSGFETRLWWSEGCHKMTAFKNLSLDSFTMTDLIAGTYLGLPMNRNLEPNFIVSISKALSRAIAV